MAYEFIEITKAERVATVVLNRPDKRNALHAPMVAELLRAVADISTDDSRVLILRGNGASFCAGGDIHWMQKLAAGSEDENYEDAQLLANLLYQLYHFPKPTIALGQGSIMGGGLGLLAACDIAVAADDTTFSFSEVKIGITPSMISPYVIAAIGERVARYYFLTGALFKAEEAHRINLVHYLVDRPMLIRTGEELAQTLLQNSPNALLAAKRLIQYVAREKITESLAQKTAEHLAELRATPEAQEGLKAFMEKRKAQW